ncbi:MAG: GNAT family N-acetyltransferase, partial [Planctomycetota bacterium]
MHIEQAKSSDFNDLITFLNTCFGVKDPAAAGFDIKCPDLYRPTDEAMGNYFLMRSEGKIAAGLGIFPMKLKLGSHELSIPGIGAVGTLPEFRGQSLMSKLLDYANEYIAEKDPPFSWLAGFRYRYGRWGWQRGGNFSKFGLTAYNAKNILPEKSLNVKKVSAEELPVSEILPLRDMVKFRGNAQEEEL